MKSEFKSPKSILVWTNHHIPPPSSDFPEIFLALSQGGLQWPFLFAANTYALPPMCAFDVGYSTLKQHIRAGHRGEHRLNPAIKLPDPAEIGAPKATKNLVALSQRRMLERQAQTYCSYPTGPY